MNKNKDDNDTNYKNSNPFHLGSVDRCDEQRPPLQRPW